MATDATASSRPANIGAASTRALSGTTHASTGIKRIALVALVAFLDRNGIELTASNGEAVSAILAVAAGEMREGGLAEWVDARSRLA